MDDSPDKANIQCYGSSGFGHLRKECPKMEDNRTAAYTKMITCRPDGLKSM